MVFEKGNPYWTKERIIIRKAKGWHGWPKGKRRFKAWNKGIPHSLQTKMNIRNARQHISAETRLKLSKARKGKKLSEQTKQKIREKLLNRKFSDETIKKMRISTINRFKKTFPYAFNKSTDLPIITELSNRGYGFYVQTPVEDICIPDISFPEKKIAIFCDGDYYHTNPNKYSRQELFDNLKPITPRIIMRRIKVINDPIQTQKLQEKGWLVLRYWEDEIKSDIQNCINEIENKISINQVVNNEH